MRRRLVQERNALRTQRTHLSAQWGLMKTFGRSHSGESAGSGSVANTSSAAPRMRRADRAAAARAIRGAACPC